MNKQKKAMLIILLFSLLIIAVYLYETYELKKEINRIDKEIEKEEELVALIDSQAKAINQDLLNSSTKNIYKKVPVINGYPQLTQFFDQIAANNHVTIDTINFDSEKGNKKEIIANQGQSSIYNTMPITIKATADDYEAIRLFIDDIYKADRFMNIKDFQLAESNEKVVTYLLIEAYYAPTMKGYVPDLEPVETYQKAGKINPVSK